MRIIISGAGIAGLAAAGFLLQQGFTPVIIEKTAEWSEVGYGISLWGNGIKMRQGLGLDEKLIKKGRKIDKWRRRKFSITNTATSVLPWSPFRKEGRKE